MKMKRNLSFILICSVATLVVSCSKQEYYNVPVDANGKAIITSVSTGSNTGITSLDGSVTVNTTLPNAKAGDVMIAEIVKSQIPPGGGTAQSLPLASTKKSVTVGSDLTTSVTYTRAETALNPGEAIVVTFSGATDSYTTPQITMTPAASIGTLQYQGKTTSLVRTAGTATLKVSVAPKGGTYTGNIVVSYRDNGTGAYTVLGTFPGSTTDIPVNPDTWASGVNSREYKVDVAQGGYTESLTTVVNAQDPFFFLKKTGTLSLTTSSQGGFLLTTGASATATATTAQIVVSGGSLSVKAGPGTTDSGRSIDFVATTAAKYDANSSSTAKADYAAGTKLAVADPTSGTGIYLFRMVLGPNPEDVYYGYLKFTSVTPGSSVSFEYRIGDRYEHLLVIK